jgi:hypothetical protein
MWQANHRGGQQHCAAAERLGRTLDQPCGDVDPGRGIACETEHIHGVNARKSTTSLIRPSRKTNPSTIADTLNPTFSTKLARSCPSLFGLRISGSLLSRKL